MRGTIVLLFLSSLALCVSTSAHEFNPNGYQLPDGAISLERKRLAALECMNASVVWTRSRTTGRGGATG